MPPNLRALPSGCTSLRRADKGNMARASGRVRGSERTKDEHFPVPVTAALSPAATQVEDASLSRSSVPPRHYGEEWRFLLAAMRTRGW